MARALTAAVAVVSLCGCTETTGNAGSEKTHVAAGTASSQTAVVGPGPAGGQGDEFLVQYLDGLAAGHDISDPPAVEVVQRVRPEEQSALVAACMEDRGWSVEIDPDDGGIMAQAPSNQVTALNQAWYICWASYPPLEQYLRPMTDGELIRLYDYYVGDLMPCLEGEGHEIDPPSRETWLEEAKVDTDYWVPYADLAGPPSPELAQQCPLAPEDDVIYGDR